VFYAENYGAKGVRNFGINFAIATASVPTGIESSEKPLRETTIFSRYIYKVMSQISRAYTNFL
jgi:hypothetical protein